MMTDLGAAYHDAGHREVFTYQASGNVVLSSAGRPDPPALSEVVVDAFGFESEAFVRTGADLAPVVERNPWPDSDALVEVSFLEREPGPGRRMGA